MYIFRHVVYNTSMYVDLFTLLPDWLDSRTT